MKPGFAADSVGQALFVNRLPGPRERCDPKQSPLGKGQGRKEVR
jgi:hypothetical protein